MTPIKTAALLTVFVAAVASPAHALTATEQAEFRRTCTADYSRLCAEFDPDSPQVQQCFQRRIAEVSPRCKATIEKIGQAARR